ncbi:MAG: TlpA family protein disulfide reductase [Defluviitaleaceae bacterium]|nr:TlpA family protein disulfide reductase [Defluviitaleaceae bacterium]
MKKKVMLFVAALFAVMLVSGCGDSQSLYEVGTPNSFGDFVTASLNGSETITPAEFMDNNLTVVKFWATWCGPCVSELPVLQRVTEEYGNRGVEVIGFMFDAVHFEDGSRDDESINHAFSLLEVAPDFRAFVPDSLILNYINDHVPFLPTTYVLNSNGEIVYHKVGASNFNEWSGLLNGLLADE